MIYILKIVILDDLPLKNGDFPSFLYVYQRVVRYIHPDPQRCSVFVVVCS